MRLTEALKTHLRTLLALAADAKPTDDEWKKHATDALTSGKLSPADLARLTTESTGGSDQVRQLIRDELAASRQESAAVVADQVKSALAGIDFKSIMAAAAPPATPPAAPTTPPALTKDELAAMAREEFSKAAAAKVAEPQKTDPNFLLARGAGAGESHTIRVKSAIERYDQTKSGLTHSAKHPVKELAGTPVMYMNTPLNRPSQADKAVIGVFSKWLYGVGSRQPGYKMTDHDNDLMEYALRELPWVGIVGADGDGANGHVVDGRKLTEFERKALLDDATSGGTYAVPVVYDMVPIISPLLTGELFPLVNVIPLARGRTVKAFSMSRPTITSGIPEGTAIPLFDTTDFIAALDTTVYPAVGSIDIGLDFEEDSPANFGQIIIDQYGEEQLRWLDEQIAIGDGTTEPLGIFNTTSMTVVPSVNGAGGPVTVGDLEALMSGVDIAFRRRGGRMVWVMNDVTYRKFRSIATAAGWNTRLFGENYESYNLFGYPVRIVPDIPNNRAAFVNLSMYRLYRRQGMYVRVVNEGRTNVLANLKTIVVRSLWGGRLELGGAGALMLDLQA